MIVLMLFPVLVFSQDVNSSRYFEQTIRPLLKQYCLQCHSSEKHKGDLDLERFSSMSEVKRHPKIFQDVAEKLANKEMPPEEQPQPSELEKQRLARWIEAMIEMVGRENAGDPGPVVLRRLSNAEYNYTIQDLTGVPSLQPAREFPVDGAAGEGFMNTGQALVMSAALVTKYLDAGKAVASHAVLLPDGIRFSSKTTRRDWTEEILAEIREFYRQYTDPHGGEKVNLQGIVFETNEGGRLPVEKYLKATLEEREGLLSGRKSFGVVARERGLSEKYLKGLVNTLASQAPSLLLDGLRTRWRSATPAQAGELTAEVRQWQQALWKFNTVGHIGKLNGPKSWMEAVNPLISKQEVKLKLTNSASATESKLYLVVTDAGDGNGNDFVIWEKPRLTAPGRPDLLLRDVRDVSREFLQSREQLFASTAKCLEAIAGMNTHEVKRDVSTVAARYQVSAEALEAWLDFLGIGNIEALRIDSYFTNKQTKISNYDFINGWGSPDTPSLVANSSEQHVRIPGNMKPHSVAVHPSPTLQACIGWRCPESLTARVEAKITHAHPECGNGVNWSLEMRRGATRQRLATGKSQGGIEVQVGPFEPVAFQEGDLVTVLISPREGNHACDLTAVDLVLTAEGDKVRRWDLAADVSADILSGNPHSDKLGHEGIWHFYTEPDNGGNGIGPVLPANSLLAKWQSASSLAEKKKLGEAVQQLLTSNPPEGEEPDAKLYQQLSSLSGPLFNKAQTRGKRRSSDSLSKASSEHAKWGLDPGLFGQHPGNRSSNDDEKKSTLIVDSADLCVQAPSVLEIRLPAGLAAGCEFVTVGRLHPKSGVEGSVQLRLLTAEPRGDSGLLPSTTTQTQAPGQWTSDNRRVAYGTPIVVSEGSQARTRFEAAFDTFRQWFPAALCYTKIVPVDETVTLTLYYREDEVLMRLMLDEAGQAKLDRLWDQLHYVSQDALMLVDAFEQLWQYATQDAEPKVFEPLRKPIYERAAAFKQRLRDTEQHHVQTVLSLAERAYRRPLSKAQEEELKELFRKLHEQELSHEDAVRLMIARVLIAPEFLYRAEIPSDGRASTRVNDWELANRLSYFLWSSMPDAELTRTAASGKLHQTKMLLTQTRRMLSDVRVRRLANEFACQWLHIHDFDNLDEKSDRHFPTFKDVRGAMYEESILFFTDLFQRNGSVLDILDADYTFLNEALAKHYNIPNISGETFRRVDGIKRFSRGGILGQATTLAKQSGASRTSPILRGNWVAEALLGDKLPKPPKDVPRLPEDEATENLTVRQLTEKHSTDPRCYHCHQRIDAFGYALEGFDAIGRVRERDLGDRLIDTHAKVMDGSEFQGLDGLRSYLLTQRREAFLRQFNRKLLGYALGRSVQISDEPLLKEMRARLEANGYRVGGVIEAIVQSKQFREIRGKEMALMLD
jgi:hypothetical protein